MARKTAYPIVPDYASPPGATLAETLEARNMTQAELAERTGRPLKTINEIVKGKSAITADTAVQLERVLAVPAKFWLQLEANYQEALAREKEAREHERQTEWLKSFPLAEMIKQNWVEKKTTLSEQVAAVLAFFGVASVEAWQSIWCRRLESSVAYRKAMKFQMSASAAAAWLRRGEIEALQAECPPYDEKKFRHALQTIRGMTKDPVASFAPATKKLCANAGVAVLFVHELPKAPVSGAAYWLNSKKAVIQLSLRYKSNDHLWFSFFHESGHILKHGKRDFFLEGLPVSDESASPETWEAEADEFARDFMIPPDDWAEFVADGVFEEATVDRFAKRQGIAAGIVVGRLQREKYLSYRTHLNSKKVRLKWADD